MAHPNEVLVREAFAAFGRGDLDALRSQYWAEDIRYHVPGRGPLAGDYEGAARVLEFFGRVFELSGGTFSAELRDVLANDEHALALYTGRAERVDKTAIGNIHADKAAIGNIHSFKPAIGNIHYEDNTVQYFDIRDGKVTEAWVYPADQYATDEFFS